MKDFAAAVSRLPLASLALLLLNVGVYVAQLSAGVPWTVLPQQQIAWGGNLALLTLTGDYWRLLTNTFLHADVVHLVLNMYFLILFGPRSERAFGRLRLLVIYLAGGILASCASAWWISRHQLHSEALGGVVALLVVSVGASGAIFAICGALLTSVVSDEWSGNSASVHEPGLGTALAQVVGINVAMGFFVKGIDQAAHVGGLISGILLAVVVGDLHARNNGAVGPARLLSSVLLVGAGFGSRCTRSQSRACSICAKSMKQICAKSRRALNANGYRKKRQTSVGRTRKDKSVWLKRKKGSSPRL